jgi:hypothetical protein
MRTSILPFRTYFYLFYNALLFFNVASKFDTFSNNLLTVFIVKGRIPVAARLLGLRVQILAGAWMFVSCGLCCQVEVSASGRSLVRRTPTECVVCLSVISKPRQRGLGPLWLPSHKNKLQLGLFLHSSDKTDTRRHCISVSLYSRK